MLNAQAQTLFSNPVGINVSPITTGVKLDVDGDVRFRRLSAGTGGFTLIGYGI